MLKWPIHNTFNAFVTICIPSFLSYPVDFFTCSKMHFLWCIVLSISANEHSITTNHGSIHNNSNTPELSLLLLNRQPTPIPDPSATQLFSCLWFSLFRVSCESNQTILDLDSFTSQNAPMLFVVWWHLSQVSTLHYLSLCRHYPFSGLRPVFVMQLQFSSWCKENLVNLKLI